MTTEVMVPSKARQRWCQPPVAEVEVRLTVVRCHVNRIIGRIPVWMVMTPETDPGVTFGGR